MSPLPQDFEHRLSRHRPEPVPEPPPRRAAVSAVLRPGAAGPEVLLMQRAVHEKDPWSGHVSLPGGSAEPEDVGLVATAMRETREELGLDLEHAGRLLCQLTTVNAVAGSRIRPMDITPFVFRLEAEVELVLNDEAADAFWLPLEPVVHGHLDGETRVQRHGVVQRFPCWDYDGRVVWGLTYRMIRQLLRAGGVAL